MAVPPPLSKPLLRRALRRARARFDGDHAMLSDRLAPLVAGARMLGGYVAHRGEPDVAAALAVARDHGIAVALPRVTGVGVMRFVGWNPGDRLSAGPVGVPEPDTGATVEPDTVLVPLLGFDRAGRRLGQGGGYYDRWLADRPSVRRIGIGWSVQEVDIVPHEPWDVVLHAVVTECEVVVP